MLYRYKFRLSKRFYAVILVTNTPAGHKKGGKCGASIHALSILTCQVGANRTQIEPLKAFCRQTRLALLLSMLHEPVLQPRKTNRISLCLITSRAFLATWEPLLINVFFLFSIVHITGVNPGSYIFGDNSTSNTSFLAFCFLLSPSSFPSGLVQPLCH